MHIAMDGIILERKHRGGVVRLFQTILPLMCTLDPSLQITLYHTHPMRHRIASHPQISTRQLLPLDHRWLRLSGLSSSLRRQWALAMGVRQRDESVWHSTYYTSLPSWTRPKVVTVHDLIQFRYPELYTKPAAEQLRQNLLREVQTADVVICVSETTKRDLEELIEIDLNKVVVVYHAAAPSFYSLKGFDKQHDFILPTTKPFLLYVGQRAGYKNFAIVLEALERSKVGAALDLVVVGPPWTESEGKLLAGKKLEQRVHLLKNIDDSQLNVLYNHALAFIYPSLYEGFGIPLLEAMSCGCPIISSDIPSTREVAKDIPYYFEPSSVDSLVAVLENLVERGSDAARITRGIGHAAQFSWQKSACGVLSCYYRAAQLPQPDFSMYLESISVSTV